MYIHQLSRFNDKNAFPRNEIFFSYVSCTCTHGRMWEYGHYATNMTVSRMYGYSKLARTFTLLLINAPINVNPVGGGGGGGGGQGGGI